ncbi:hypothetical protein [Devosia sp. LC5]|uniref:hypothetical protein n=1 Tax=Devosia sp. LC5 TaxID=1502724 RepID=UPI00126799ED|nr:hypothetical protein [Devosia sp. LC5]
MFPYRLASRSSILVAALFGQSRRLHPGDGGYWMSPEINPRVPARPSKETPGNLGPTIAVSAIAPSMGIEAVQMAVACGKNLNAAAIQIAPVMNQ